MTTNEHIATLTVATLTIMMWWSVFAHAHDNWISQGGFVNKVGEWCCGEKDCFVLPTQQVREVAGGYEIVVLPNQGAGEHARAEFVPHAETQSSPDGAYWRCKRPDGTRRCFFAPPPNT